MPSPIRVGIIGLQPGQSWASRAHVPALRSLPDLFELHGVANKSLASAQRAAASASIPHAFPDAGALLASPDIDLVAVTMRVPAHFAIVKAAIEAGKHVYCEWPLGNGLAEAEKMAELARRSDVVAVVGTQAVVAPEIVHLQRLVADGFIGEILSTSLVGTGGPQQGSGAISEEKTYAYLLDRANGASLLTIPVGHALAAVRHVLGRVDQVAAVVATRRKTAKALDTGNILPVTAPDQVLVSGLLESGAPISIHYRGGDSRDAVGLRWEIHGTRGDLLLTGPSGHLQMVPLQLSAARDGGRCFERVSLPHDEERAWPRLAEAGNVARLYASMAQDILSGERTAPHFDDAVALHRTIAAIEMASEQVGNRCGASACEGAALPESAK